MRWQGEWAHQPEDGMRDSSNELETRNVSEIARKMREEWEWNRYIQVQVVIVMQELGANGSCRGRKDTEKENLSKVMENCEEQETLTSWKDLFFSFLSLTSMTWNRERVNQSVILIPFNEILVLSIFFWLQRTLPSIVSFLSLPSQSPSSNSYPLIGFGEAKNWLNVNEITNCFTSYQATFCVDNLKWCRHSDVTVYPKLGYQFLRCTQTVSR